MTDQFFCSTYALSFLFAGRERVKVIWRASTHLARWWLMNSLPLSEWIPARWNGSSSWI